MKAIQRLENISHLGEQVIYTGKPDKKCFIYETIFNPMLPFSILWLIMDVTFSTVFLTAVPELKNFLLVFLMVHLMPLWLYLSGVIGVIWEYKNTAYLITDKAIYKSKGKATLEIKRVSFDEIEDVNMYRGIFDKMFDVGDVKIATNIKDEKGIYFVIGINGIIEYLEIYEKTKKKLLEIKDSSLIVNESELQIYKQYKEY